MSVPDSWSLSASAERSLSARWRSSTCVVGLRSLRASCAIGRDGPTSLQAASATRPRMATTRAPPMLLLLHRGQRALAPGRQVARVRLQAGLHLRPVPDGVATESHGVVVTRLRRAAGGGRAPERSPAAVGQVGGVLLETAQHPAAAKPHVLAESFSVGPALRHLAPCDLCDARRQDDACKHQDAQLHPHRSFLPFVHGFVPAGATYTDAEVSLKLRVESAAWNELDGSGSHGTQGDSE